MTPEWEKEIKEHYDEIVAKCRNHVFGMAFDSPVGRNLADTSAEEVQRVFEENWNGSFRWVFETFDDLLSNPEANRAASQFIIDKMKERVDDPEIAQLLTPSVDDYPLFAKRPPLDHGYLEAFNRDNVHLIDIKDREPLVEIDETGVRTTEKHYEFDIIVLATGFRAYTGALEAFPIRGKSGQTLREKWEKTSNAIMGVCAADFPNLFMVTGPQAPFANLPTSIEQNVIWITDCINKMEREGYDVFSPRQEAEDQWSAHVAEVHAQTLMHVGDQVHSWMMGANIEGHQPRILIYFRRRQCLLRQTAGVGQRRLPRTGVRAPGGIKIRGQFIQFGFLEKTLGRARPFNMSGVFHCLRSDRFECYQRIDDCVRLIGDGTLVISLWERH